MPTLKIYTPTMTHADCISGQMYAKAHDVDVEIQEIGMPGHNENVRAMIMAEFMTLANVIFKVGDTYINGYNESEIAAALGITP